MSLPKYTFDVGATVRVAYRELRKLGLNWPDRAEVLAVTVEGYHIRTEDGGHELQVPHNGVFGVCGCAWPGYSGGCLALIHHGPGHQSHTHCRIPASKPHEIHEAVFGEFRQFATWRGNEASTGFFDDAPEADA